MKNKLIIGLLHIFVLSFAQVGINTDHPDPSAILDLGPGNRGFLFPRVPLLSNTDVTTIPDPAHSLQVYNTSEVSDVISSNTFYYYDDEDMKWNRLVSKPVADTIIAEIQVPIYVGHIYKTDSQVLTSLNNAALNVIHFTQVENVFNNDVIEFLPGSDSTFLIKKSGTYVVEGYANLKLTTPATTFWTVALQKGVSDDNNISVPATFEYGMRCPYYIYESDKGFLTTCNFSGAIYLQEGSIIRMIAMRKNGVNPTAGTIGGPDAYGASLKLIYYPN